MKAPETYFEWKEMLEKFAKGDDSLSQLLNQGKMNLDAGTAVRYHSLVNEAYIKRKQLWLDKFKMTMQNQVIKSTSDFAVYLNQTKTGLRVLIDFTQLNSFPNDLKKTLEGDLVLFVTQIKKSLKENVQKKHGAQMNSLILAIDNLDVHKVASASSSPQQPENFTPNKRRIIF